MVIACGRSTRQVAAMAQKLSERIKRELGRGVRIEGLPVADWVLIDAGDVIVHLFRPEVRSFYNLERMWAFGDAPPAEPTPAQRRGSRVAAPHRRAARSGAGPRPSWSTAISRHELAGTAHRTAR